MAVSRISDRIKCLICFILSVVSAKLGVSSALRQRNVLRECRRFPKNGGEKPSAPLRDEKEWRLHMAAEGMKEEGWRSFPRSRCARHRNQLESGLFRAQMRNHMVEELPRFMCIHLSTT